MPSCGLGAGLREIIATHLRTFFRMPRAIPLASVVVAASTSALQAQLIQNGGFDTPVPRNETGGGWTTSHIDGSGGWFDSSGTPGGNFILNDAGDPATDPTISQLVSGLSPGGAYVLTGDFASAYSGFGNSGGRFFGIDLDGVNVAMLPRPGGEGVFGHFSIGFVAGGSSVLVAFRGEINGDDSSYRIDNIALTSGCEIAASIKVQGLDVLVCWPTDSNLHYQVQVRSDLAGGTWSSLGAPVVGDGTPQCLADPISGQSQRFYQVICAPAAP